MRTVILITAMLIVAPAAAQEYTIHRTTDGSSVTIYAPGLPPLYADRIPGTDRYIVSDGRYPATVERRADGYWTVEPSPYLTMPDDDGY